MPLVIDVKAAATAADDWNRASGYLRANGWYLADTAEQSVFHWRREGAEGELSTLAAVAWQVRATGIPIWPDGE